MGLRIQVEAPEQSMPLDAILKFRCEQSLIDRLEAIAKAQRRDLPDLCRIIMEDYAVAQEELLGISFVSTNPARPASGGPSAESLLDASKGLGPRPKRSRTP